MSPGTARTQDAHRMQSLFTVLRPPQMLWGGNFCCLYITPALAPEGVDSPILPPSSPDMEVVLAYCTHCLSLHLQKL